MDAVLRAVVVYLVLLVLFRATGKRTIATMTTFDFVLILVIGEATQQALLGEDFSITMGTIVIATLIALDRFSDFLGYRFPRADKLLESVPVLLVDQGRVIEERLARAHVGVDDILTAARRTQGLESLTEVKYAVLERDGGISIVPKG